MIILALALASVTLDLKPGTTVTLGPGPYDLIEITGKTFDPPVTIDAGTTVVNGLRIWNSSGIIWRGGVIKAPGGHDGFGPTVYGADVRMTKGLTFDGTTFTDALRGAVIADSTDVTIRNVHFTGLRSDGLDLAGGNNVLIEKSRFDTFAPVKPTGSKHDGTWKDGDHPDAIQIWNTPKTRFGTNIVIRDNIVDGDTQGISFFGPPMDGYSKVTVENNDIRISYPSAISLFSCTDCNVRNNRIVSIPGSRFKTNVRFEKSVGKLCGNTLPSIPNHIATQAC